MSDRILVESEAYRRGIVLGLTLAEVGILLVFVLLMLVGFEHYRASQEPGLARPAAAELDALRRRDAALRELEQSFPGAAVPISDDFVRLVLDAARRLDDAGGAEVLAQLREASAELDATRRELVSALNAIERGQIAARIERQARRAAADRRRIAELEHHLAGANALVEGQSGQLAQLRRSLGNGRVYPSCLASADGGVRYLYDIWLTDAGLEARKRGQPAVGPELPALPDLAGKALPPEEFLRLTAPLYRWSVDHGCRFFVRVYDATGADQKVRFKSLLATVEAHFYKYLSSRAEPSD